MCYLAGDTFSVVDDEFRTKALKVRRISDKDIIAQIAYELAEEIFKTIVSSSSGRNQAQGSSGRSLVQALSRTAVPVSLP